MSSILPSSFLLKRIMAFVMVLIAIRYRAMIWFVLVARPRMLRLLPRIKGWKEHAIVGHMPALLDGTPFDPEHFTRMLTKRLQTLAYQNKEPGFCCMMGFNSNIPLLNNLGICYVTNINVARELLATKTQPFWLKGVVYDVSDQLIGDSVLRMSGPTWEMQRKLIEKGFIHSAMENVTPRVLKTCMELVGKWETGIAKATKHNTTFVADVRVEMLKFTMDVICRSAFDFDCGSLTAATDEDAPLYMPFQTILTGLERRGQYLHEHLTRFLPTKRNLELDAAICKLDSIVDRILEKKKTAPITTTSSRDFLDILLEHAGGGGDAGSNTMSYKVLKDNLKTLLFAGHDTTGALIAWLLWLLAGHKEEMAKLKREIFTVVGRNSDPTYEQLESLHYLNAIVMETLRLYPSAGFTRRPAVETTLCGYMVPRMTEMLVLPYIFHRDPANWANPNDFLPDRFLKEGLEGAGEDDGGNTNSRVDSLQSRIGRISRTKAFIPFSYGPRNCVGRPLALMEMRMVVIKLLQRFNFDRVDDDPYFDEVPVLTLTLNPASIKLKVTLDGAA